MKPPGHSFPENVPALFGCVTLVIGTSRLRRFKPTSGLNDATAQISDAFEKAQEDSSELAGRLAATVKDLKASGKLIGHLVLEPGLLLAIEDSLLFVTSAADALLKTISL